jgi:hypothetical protein
LVTLDCRGENDSETRGAAVLDAQLESLEHVVGVEEITDPSLEPLLQEVSSEVIIILSYLFQKDIGIY